VQSVAISFRGVWGIGYIARLGRVQNAEDMIRASRKITSVVMASVHPVPKSHQHAGNIDSHHARPASSPSARS
jgi:hypothetical protein